MCLGIYVCCVLVVLCLSLGCVFCFLWCVACCWMCFVSVSCVLVSCAAGLVWGCVCLLGVLCMCLCCLLYGVCSFIGCAVCFMCGVVSLLVCCVWCFGCWSLPVWLWWVSGFGRVLFFVFGFWLGFVFWLVAGVLFFVGRWCAGLVGGLFLLVVWVVFVCWGWRVASYFFGAILFVLIVVGLSGLLLASAFCLVLQPVF